MRIGIDIIASGGSGTTGIVTDQTPTPVPAGNNYVISGLDSNGNNWSAMVVVPLQPSLAKINILADHPDRGYEHVTSTAPGWLNAGNQFETSTNFTPNDWGGNWFWET